MFDAVCFAGGGNRCYWQGGFWEAAREALALEPRLVTGVNNGAWAACYSLAGIGPSVRRDVISACESATRNVDWKGWRAGGALFPVGPLYRQLLENHLTEAVLADLRAKTDLQILIARPPGHLPQGLAVALGIGLYQIEKKVIAPVHPKGGKWLGFTPEFVRLRQTVDRAAWVDAMLASASVPPMVPVGIIAGAPAMDGGMVDNVPVQPLEAIEAQGGRTLVMLTRRYRKLPQIRGRTYIQPSVTPPVSQFELTNPGGIRTAYETGLKDGAAFVKAMGR